MKLKDFSITLGFHKRCTFDPNELANKHRYDRNSWWSAISNEHVSSKNSIVSIHNPTLRFLAKWLAMVVHPRADLRLCSLPELQYLYAMAKQIRCSPVRTMLSVTPQVSVHLNTDHCTPFKLKRKMWEINSKRKGQIKDKSYKRN